MVKFVNTVNIRKPNVILQNQQGNIIKVNGIRKLAATLKKTRHGI